MKILILSFFLVPFSFLFSQGNLQFNQVITISGSFIGGPTTKIDLGTVPVGKVWKLEYYAASGTFAAGIFVNNIVFVENKLMWFKANDLLSMKGNCASCGTCASCASYSYFVSIVEFNIIP
jgi:hypothetical protein